MHVCISAPTVPQDGVERPVNRALFCQSYAGIFNVQSPAKYKLYAYSLFSYFSSKEVMGTSGLLMEPGGGWWRWWVGGPVVWPNMPVQGTGTALLEQHTLKALHFSFLFGPADVFPLRRSDWSLDKVAKWEARGYARSDVEAYLTTYGEAIPSFLRCKGAASRCCCRGQSHWPTIRASGRRLPMLMSVRAHLHSCSCCLQRWWQSSPTVTSGCVSRPPLRSGACMPCHARSHPMSMSMSGHACKPCKPLQLLLPLSCRNCLLRCVGKYERSPPLRIQRWLPPHFPAALH